MVCFVQAHLSAPTRSDGLLPCADARMASA